MSFINYLQIVLPLLLYFSGFILLVILIILSLRLLKIMNRMDLIIENVDKKVRSLDGIFSLIDFCTDKISNITNKLVDRLTNIVIGVNKNKYNNKDEE